MAADLAWAAQGVTGWRRSALPKGIRLALEAEVTVHGKGSRAKRLPQAGAGAGNATPPMSMLLIDRFPYCDCLCERPGSFRSPGCYPGRRRGLIRCCFWSG